MKSILATIIIGTSPLIFQAETYAGDELNVTPIAAEKKVKVELNSPKSIDVSILVANMDGKVLHEETIKSRRSYGRVYDFTNLKDGQYTIISEDDYITTTTEVKIHRSDIDVLSNEVEYKPIFLTKGGSLMVNYLNINAEDIKFSIENGDAVVYESDGGNDISFQKILNISKMPSGDYFANIEAGSRTYSYYFFVR